ncbi:MAG: hypothetical protein K2O03_10495 [Lachnospiraceae bacterium]|nr:hypothetical protein [Lachnospiraceae bacterium]
MSEGSITVKQVEWIFDRTRDFMAYWVGNPPTNEGEWRRLMEQVHDLVKRGRNHPLLMGVMVQVLGYIGETEEKGIPSQKRNSI